jgi:hypothetical protein
MRVLKPEYKKNDLMKRYMTKLLLAVTLGIGGLSYQSHAQGQFKAGIGAALVSNEGDHPAFNTFLAPSLHLGYAVSLSPVLKLGVENYLVLRSKETDNTRRYGFAAALPVTLEFRFPKVSFYTGAGPAYVSQRVENDNRYGNDRIRGSYGDIMVGAGFRKRRIAEYLIMENSLRFHYLKSFSSTREDGVMLSFIVGIGGEGNAQK